MTLGFSVDALAPVSRGGGALRMGLRRLAESDWLQPEFDRQARADAFARHPDAIHILPGAEDAGREVAAMVGACLPVEAGLAEAAHATWEDLCILQPVGEGGEHRLTAAAVAFPTDWRLADKMGRSLLAIHAPIHGYVEQLNAGVEHFVRTLAPGPIFGRSNWFVVPTGAWRYLPRDDPADRFASVDAANAGERLWVRSERQTLRRLPRTGALLFTIGVAAERLDRLSPRTVRHVADAANGVGAGEGERRAAPFYADALAGYADALDRGCGAR
ncbi:MAG TPA: DUF3445 domain-containing protein [Sphingomonadaceae bacterium]|nr:DUF3445 domain-containing protein [Sphingomonadaceae bacterium]